MTKYADVMAENEKTHASFMAKMQNLEDQINYEKGVKEEIDKKL